jgi:HEAT repeat protein
MAKLTPELMVDGLLNGNWIHFSKLKEMGERVVPLLVRALDDPRAAVTPERGGARPLDRICDLIEPYAPAEAVGAMAKFAEHPNPWVRLKAYYLLAKIGTPPCAGALVGALQGRDDEEKKGVVMALWHKINADRQYGPGFTGPVFDALAERLDQVSSTDLTNTAVAMLRLDMERAVATLTVPERFRPENPELVSLLHAFKVARIVVPREALLPIMPVLRAESDATIAGGRGKYPYEAALPVLARSVPEAARPLVEEALQSTDMVRRDAASSAMEVLAAVDGALDAVNRRLWRGEGRGAPQLDLDALTVGQRNYYLSFEADARVTNGGLAQFFLNPSGRFADETPAALEAIGAPRAAEAVRRARELIRSLPPKAHGQTLYDMLSRPDVRERLGRIETEFFNDTDDIITLLRLYAARHAEDFREARRERNRSRP